MNLSASPLHRNYFQPTNTNVGRLGERRTAFNKSVTVKLEIHKECSSNHLYVHRVELKRINHLALKCGFMDFQLFPSEGYGIKYGKLDMHDLVIDKSLTNLQNKLFPPCFDHLTKSRIYMDMFCRVEMELTTINSSFIGKLLFKILVSPDDTSRFIQLSQPPFHGVVPIPNFYLFKCQPIHSFEKQRLIFDLPNTLLLKHKENIPEIVLFHEVKQARLKFTSLLNSILVNPVPLSASYCKERPIRIHFSMLSNLHTYSHSEGNGLRAEKFAGLNFLKTESDTLSSMMFLTNVSEVDSIVPKRSQSWCIGKKQLAISNIHAYDVNCIVDWTSRHSKVGWPLVSYCLANTMAPKPFRSKQNGMKKKRNFQEKFCPQNVSIRSYLDSRCTSNLWLNNANQTLHAVEKTSRHVEVVSKDACIPPVECSISTCVINNQKMNEVNTLPVEPASPLADPLSTERGLEADESNFRLRPMNEMTDSLRMKNEVGETALVDRFLQIHNTSIAYYGSQMHGETSDFSKCNEINTKHVPVEIILSVCTANSFPNLVNISAKMQYLLCFDFPIKDKISAIVNGGVGVVLLEEGISVQDLRSIVKSITLGALKFCHIWFIMLRSSSHSNEQFFRLIQTTEKFPCEVFFRECRCNSEDIARLLVYICNNSREFGNDVSIKSCFNDEYIFQAHCDLLQHFPFANFFLAGQLLSHSVLSDIVKEGESFKVCQHKSLSSKSACLSKVLNVPLC